MEYPQINTFEQFLAAIPKDGWRLKEGQAPFIPDFLKDAV